MNCGICLEDDIIEKNIHYMECLHYTCFDCFVQFINNSCPFCRQEIQLYTSSKIVNEESEDIVFENDFIIPIIRKDRHDKKRKKIQKRKQTLNKLIESQKNINYYIPNIKSRFNKKLDNILI